MADAPAAPAGARARRARRHPARPSCSQQTRPGVGRGLHRTEGRRRASSTRCGPLREEYAREPPRDARGPAQDRTLKLAMTNPRDTADRSARWPADHAAHAMVPYPRRRRSASGAPAALQGRPAATCSGCSRARARSTAMKRPVEHAPRPPDTRAASGTGRGAGRRAAARILSPAEAVRPSTSSPSILEYAVVAGASDIHIEPYEMETPGALPDRRRAARGAEPAPAAQPSLTARIKMLSGDAHRRAPYRPGRPLRGRSLRLRGGPARVLGADRSWGEKIVHARARPARRRPRTSEDLGLAPARLRDRCSSA